MTEISTVTIGAGIVGLTMIVGLFWGWAVSAVPGLRDVDDRTYVTSMQSINRAILNPMFLATFVGTVLVLILAAVTTFIAGDSRRGVLITIAAGLYTFGVFGVTIGGNVPLNDQLESFEMDSADDQAISRARTDYEGPWNRLHLIRSGLGVLAVGFAAAAALTSVED